MPPLYIHIGTHKTGTTSIQVFLKQYEDRLARQSIHVPVAGRVSPGSAGQHNIAWSLRADPRSEDRYGAPTDLTRELAGVRARCAVLSSEDFEYLVDRPELLSKFEAQVRASGWSPHYILFLRNTRDYAISLYHELQKHGDTDDFTTFATEILEHGYRRSHGDWVFYFDYPTFITRWRAAATGPMTILSYDAACQGMGVIETLLDILGAPPALARAAAPGAKPWRRLLGRLGLDRARPQPLARLNTNARAASADMLALADRIGAAYPLPEQLLSPRPRP